MKKRLISIAAVLVLIFSLHAGCKKNKNYEDAIVTAYDWRICICCGGLMITFTHDPDPYNEKFYLIRDMPGNLSIDSSTDFPVYVRADYQILTGICGDSSYVDILEWEYQ